MSPYMLPAGQGKATWFLNTLVVEKTDIAQTGSAFSLTEQMLPPGFETPYHMHHAEDEGFYLLAGELEFVGPGGCTRLQPGGYLHAPREVAHSFRVVGSEVAKVLVCCTPAGFEQFVVEAGEPATALELPTPQPPDFARLAAVAANYHIDILEPLSA